MSRTVCIEHYELLVDITYLADVAPNHGTWDSDWDYYGYREMEFEVVGGTEFDEDGNESPLGRNACAALSEQYAEEIEQALWDQLDEEGDDVDYDDSRDYDWEAA